MADQLYNMLNVYINFNNGASRVFEKVSSTQIAKNIYAVFVGKEAYYYPMRNIKEIQELECSKP